MRNPARALVVGSATAAIVASLALAAAGQDATATVVHVRVEGVVDPFIANAVDGAIDSAEERGARAVLITIDTPGGLDSSMRQITQAILNARVPVLCLVAPEGARAASAGTFILLSCHVAAMAPATNVGAAHPVGVSGAIASQKAENDAAEYIRALAERRGRNADWAERAVRDSESASASEALALGVIDLIAPDVPSLFRAVQGRTVELADGRPVTLDLTGAEVEERRLGLVARLFHALLDPNVAFILFYLGLIALYFELANPGLGAPAIVGVVLLVAAFLAFGVLPVQLAGVILLVASAIFFAIEVFTPGVGVPLAGGLVTLVLGGMFLFDTSVPGARVSPLVLAPVALFVAAFFGLVVRAVIRAQRAPAISTPQSLVGGQALVVRALDPEGVVQVAGEEWTAESVRGDVPRGAHVRILAVEGLRLRVEPSDAPEPAEPSDAARPSEPGLAEGSVT